MNLALQGSWFTLAAVAMLFAGLSSAYLVSEGIRPQWREVGMTPWLWANTLLLALSSLLLQFGKTRWTLATGVLFLAGQLGVFQQFAAAGVQLAATRQGAFFYVLAGLHGIHVAAGLAAMIFSRNLPALRVYWHGMGVLWLYLLALIFS